MVWARAVRSVTVPWTVRGSSVWWQVLMEVLVAVLLFHEQSRLVSTSPTARNLAGGWSSCPLQYHRWSIEKTPVRGFSLIREMMR